MKPRFQSVMLLSLFISTSVFAQPNKKDSTLNRPSTSSESTTSSNSGSIVVRDQTPEAPAGTPLRAIQDLEKKMDDYQTGDDASAEQKAKNAQIKKEIINGTFDIRELCKLALDKNWGQRSAAEQNQFVSLMTQLLEKKAILSKEQSRTKGKKLMIKYAGESFISPQKDRARVKTTVKIPKEDVNIAIEYKLVKMGNEWKVFDVIVDDASLVDNYKYQFNSIITKHGFAELMSRIQKKLNEVGSST